MASSRNRQRALARAKLERQMARRAAAARKRRQALAIVGIVVAVVVVAGGAGLVVWANTGKDSGHKTTPKAAATTAAATDACYKKAGSGNKNLKDVGMPDSSTIPRSGTQQLTLTTNLGTIDVAMDVTHAPCNAGSFAYLANKKFFDGSTCHREAANPPMLQCGDPTGTGSGGPTYTVKDENLPKGKKPTYPRGTIAVANTGQPDSGSSQFFIMYKDSTLPANYSVLGTVTKGMSVVDKVAKGGNDGAFDPSPGGGHPKIKITIKTARAGKVKATASPSASRSGAAKS